MSDLLDQARRVAERAQALGAQEAKVSLSRSRGVSVEWRDGAIERLQDHTDQGLSVSLFVDGRFSRHGTSDMRPEAVERFLSDAITMTRYLEADECRSLPDPERYAGRAEIDLDLRDPSYEQVSAEQRRAEVTEVEAIAREALSNELKGKEAEVSSVSSVVGDYFGQSARVHTNGFEGAREGTSFYMTAGVTLKESNGKRPLGSAFTYRRHRSDLRSVEEIAREAVRDVTEKLNAQKLASGRYTVLVKSDTVGRLLSYLLAPLSGGALQQKRSLFEDKLNTKIVSELLTLRDNPHRPRGFSSALWDSDGFATAPRPIIEKGVLKTFLIGDYHAKKMSLESGSPVWATGASLHNMEIELGELSFDGLVREAGDGVMIDRFLGGNSNPSTGELSLGCGGRLIKNGQLTDAVTEFNLSGRFDELWSQLVMVGGDPYPEGQPTPSCLFEGVQLSGV
jgi:PmbA protein